MIAWWARVKARDRGAGRGLGRGGEPPERKGVDSRIPIERSWRSTKTREGCSPKRGCFGPWAAVARFTSTTERSGLGRELGARNRETGRAESSRRQKRQRLGPRGRHTERQRPWTHCAPPSRSGRNAVKRFVHRRCEGIHSLRMHAGSRLVSGCSVIDKSWIAERRPRRISGSERARRKA